MHTNVGQAASWNISAKQFANAALAWIALTAGGAAHAGFMGTQMGVGYYMPDTSTPYASAVFTPSTFTVGAGQETTGNVEDVTNILIDFSDNRLSITFDTVLGSPIWNSNSFNGVIFTATGPLNIASAVVDAATTMAGFDNFRISYTDNQILLNWQGLGYIDGTTVDIAFTSASAVPVPGTLALLGIGFAGLAWRRRQ